jgi:guanylate kinase
MTGGGSVLTGALGQTRPVILAGPSGAGKTTIRKHLLAGDDGWRFLFSISMTTRCPRPNERDGVDYRFVERDKFESLVKAGAMVEYALVHGQWYGTPSANLNLAIRRGLHLLLDIDIQGVRQIRARLPEVVSIFVVPPTGARIIEQLKGRGSESQDELERRIATARTELTAVDEFDHIVVNDRLEVAVDTVREIVFGGDQLLEKDLVPDSSLISNLIEELKQV